MPSLEQMAIGRAGMALPSIPGDGLKEQLVNARNTAEGILRKYVPDFSFSEEDAASVNGQVSGWAQRNELYLKQIFADTSQQDMPEALQFELGKDLFQQWIIAQFTVAAAGMGPWQSGYLEKTVFSPTNTQYTQRWAEEDGNIRLQMLQYIILMEQQGDLQRAFAPNSVNGFGELTAGTIILIIAIVAVVAAVVAATILWSQQLEANNKIMHDLCLRAKEEDDKDAIEQCISATQELQTGGPYAGIASELGKVLMVVGAVGVAAAVLFKYVEKKI